MGSPGRQGSRPLSRGLTSLTVVLATKITHGRVASPFTAREVYRNEWAGLTGDRHRWLRGPATTCRPQGPFTGGPDQPSGLAPCARTAQSRRYGQWCTTLASGTPAFSHSPLTSRGVYERRTESGPS
jgi:hypothetical protein